MAKNVTCDLDRFAKSLGELVADIPDAYSEEVGKAVQQSVRSAAKKLRGEYTENIGVHEWSKEYREGFKSHTDKSGMQTVGEVGNKAKPGLVHLLEKGHVTLTGRRTRPFPHMDPAFEDMQEDFVKRAEKAVMKAVG